MTKTNNKGFSLVELIIVIAIMAILIGVLAPQYIKYVERSRVSTDEDMMDSVMKAVQTAISDEDFYDNISVKDTATISAAGLATGSTGLQNAFDEFYGTTGGIDANKKFKSKTYENATCTIEVTANTGASSTGFIIVRTVNGATDNTKNGSFK